MPNFAQNDDRANRTTWGSTHRAISAFGTCISRSLFDAPDLKLTTTELTEFLVFVIHQALQQIRHGNLPRRIRSDQGWLLGSLLRIECSGLWSHSKSRWTNARSTSGSSSILIWRDSPIACASLSGKSSGSSMSTCEESIDHMRWTCYNLKVRYDSCPIARFLRYSVSEIIIPIIWKPMLNYHLLYILDILLLFYHSRLSSITAGTEKVKILYRTIMFCFK